MTFLPTRTLSKGTEKNYPFLLCRRQVVTQERKFPTWVIVLNIYCILKNAGFGFLGFLFVCFCFKKELFESTTLINVSDEFSTAPMSCHGTDKARAQWGTTDNSSTSQTSPDPAKADKGSSSAGHAHSSRQLQTKLSKQNLPGSALDCGEQLWAQNCSVKTQNRKEF